MSMCAREQRARRGTSLEDGVSRIGLARWQRRVHGAVAPWSERVSAQYPASCDRRQRPGAELASICRQATCRGCSWARHNPHVRELARWKQTHSTEYTAEGVLAQGACEGAGVPRRGRGPGACTEAECRDAYCVREALRRSERGSADPPPSNGFAPVLSSMTRTRWSRSRPVGVLR